MSILDQFESKGALAPGQLRGNRRDLQVYVYKLPRCLYITQFFQNSPSIMQLVQTVCAYFLGFSQLGDTPSPPDAVAVEGMQGATTCGNCPSYLLGGWTLTTTCYGDSGQTMCW